MTTPTSGKLNRWAAFTPWLVWGLAAFFFFAHYVVRVTPGHITQELQNTFIDTTKVDIGLLGASFYLPYVVMQMPVGYLVDKFGSRLLLTIAVLICALSCFIFASATILKMAIFSRILLGFCSATAFIGALKLITVWFEPRKLALLVGTTQALGMIGAAAGAHLAPYLNDTIGWHKAFHFYSLVFFVLAILIFLVVRNRPNDSSIFGASSESSSKKTLNKFSLSSVILNKYTWINALYAGLIYAPTDVMGEYWGKEFIENIHQLNPLENQASHAISLLFIGWAIGGPLAGTLADHIGRKRVMIISSFCGLILLPIIFYVPHISTLALMILLFTYGFTNTGLIASYTAAGELHNREHGGFSIAIANMFSVLLGAMLMPLLGWLLDLNASSHMINQGTALVYTVVDYQRATLVLLLCTFVAFICAFFTKETLPKR